MRSSGTGGTFLGRVLSWWNTRTLAVQFGIVSTPVLLAGMLILGVWVSQRIEDGVAHASASSAALFMNSMLAPFVKTFEATGELTSHDRDGLSGVAAIALDQRRVVSIKLWRPDGRVAFATDRTLEGKTFEPGEALSTALKGSIAWEFDDLFDPENQSELAFGIPLIEIYAPLRDDHGRVYAVAEFYEDAQVIAADVRRARAQTWIVTASVTFGILAVLYWIVARGSNTIATQQAALDARVRDMSEMLEHNRALQASLKLASRRAAESHESLLNQIGSDLHDGAAQLMCLALLKLDDAPSLSEPGNGSIREILNEALGEVRAVSSGLMMPEVRELRPSEAIDYICEVHERRTGTSVERQIATLPPVPEYTKICLCRVVQEALSNAFRHAGGIGQKVVVWVDRGEVICKVLDDGPGVPPDVLDQATDRMGLVGLRQRLGNLGGQLSVRTRSSGGTVVTASLPLSN